MTRWIAKILSSLLSATLVILACTAWTHGLFLTQGWHNVIFGGGGFITGSDFPATGVRFIRTDANGAYIWDAANSRWYNVTCQKCIPVNATLNALNFGFYPTTGTSQHIFAPSPINGVVRPEDSNGVLELVGAPSDSTVAYLYYNGHLLVSTNINPANVQNITFTDTLFLGGLADNVLVTGTNWRANNHVVAVDPYNKDHVIVATQTTTPTYAQTGGFWESFNASSGPSSTWTQISSASIPSTTTSQAGYIAFDPNSGTSACPGGIGVCANKVYIWTPGATAGVYATSNAEASWALLSGSPATAQTLVVNADPNPANGGGDVFVVDGTTEVDTNAAVWRYHGGTWTKVLAGPCTGGGCHSIAINPNNGLHVVVVTPKNLYVSTDGGATFPNNLVYDLAAGDSPWQIWMSSRTSTTAGSLVFDPAVNDQVFFTGGQGAWKAPFSTSSITFTAMVAGVEELNPGNALQVGAAYTPTFGFQDESGCRVNILTNTYATPPTSCIPLAAFEPLTYFSGLSSPPSNPSFMVGKASYNFSGGINDYSGYSTDGFGTTYTPFNTWNTTVTDDPTNFSDNGAGLIRVKVPSTSGLSTWANGSGSIVCSHPSSVVKNVSNPLNSLYNQCWEITVDDATHFSLSCINLTICGYAKLAPTVVGRTYTFWVPATTLFSNWYGGYTVTNVASNAGKVQITVARAVSGSIISPAANPPISPICISGVTMTGATAVNGCWLISAVSGNNITLADSTFVGGDTYSTGGDARIWNLPTGTIAAASTTNFAIIAGDNGMPQCTMDGGQTWTDLTGNSAVLPPTTTTVTGGPYAAGATSFTVASTTGLTSANTQFIVYLDDGRPIYEKIVSTVGSTITFDVAIPPGASVTAGNKVSLNQGFILFPFSNSRAVSADQVAPNTFFAANFISGLVKWTNCNPPTIVNSSVGTWFVGGSTNAQIEMVPNESGHGFFTVGSVGSPGSNHPATNKFFRFCNGDSNSVTMQQVPGFYEVRTFGFGAPAPGHSYAAIYVAGWYDPGGVQANAVWGIWKSIDDANHGNSGPTASCSSGNTWTNIASCTASPNGCSGTGGFPVGWQNTSINKISGDPFVYGLVYANAKGQFWGYFP